MSPSFRTNVELHISSVGLNRFAVWVVSADLRCLQILGRNSLLILVFSSVCLLV
jgi:hypothetical protein